MKHNELSLTTQALNELFASITSSEDEVLWIMDTDYKNELYIDPNIEKLTDITANQMYQDWTHGIRRLASIGRVNQPKQVIAALRRRTLLKPSTTYCITKKSGHTVYFRDTLLLPIYYKEKDLELNVGVMKKIPYREYIASLHCQNHQNVEKLKTIDLFKRINEFRLLSSSEKTKDKNSKANKPKVMINSSEYFITNREAECLKNLLLGMSSKMIANTMNISVRTAELHIHNIKQKTNIRSRIELITKIKNKHDYI